MKTCRCNPDLSSAHVTLTSAERDTARRSPLLASLSESSEARLLEGARVQSARAGQIIIQQDEPAEALFIVLVGWIKLYRMAPSGTEAVVATPCAMARTSVRRRPCVSNPISHRPRRSSPPALDQTTA